MDKNTFMRYLLSFILLFISVLAFAQSRPKIHFKAILIDTHNDMLSSSVLEGKDISHRMNSGQSDLDRWKEGGVDVQFFSVWTGDKPRNKERFYKDANQEIDSLEFLILRNQGRMTPGYTFKDVIKGIRQKKLVALIGVQGGHMNERDMNKLDSLYKRGMLYMTLTWNNSNN